MKKYQQRRRKRKKSKNYKFKQTIKMIMTINNKFKILNKMNQKTTNRIYKVLKKKIIHQQKNNKYKKFK